VVKSLDLGCHLVLRLSLQSDVAVEGQSELIRVSVSNDGDGILDTFRDHIFKPFSQAAPLAARARGGTGLRLNSTIQIVEQSGGEMGFENEESGRTTFWFTVPSMNRSDGFSSRVGR